MTVPASRLITLIMLLQRQANQKAGDLALELCISVRTLHRYFHELDEMGIPVYSERGPNGGFSLVRGYRMPPLVLTPEEAVTVYLGVGMVEEIWGQLYREAVRGARAKLENLLPDEQRQEAAWARRTLVATGMHRGSLDAVAPMLERLRCATREYRQVSMVYQSWNQKEGLLRVLDPYAIVHRWGWWYVIGFCHYRQAVRTFRVDRIMELTLLESTFILPAEFDLSSYLETERQMQKMLDVQLQFRPEMERLVFENRYVWESLDKQPDGSFIVNFNAPDAESAVSLVVGFGPGVVVLGPTEVREKLLEWVAAIHRRYSEG